MKFTFFEKHEGYIMHNGKVCKLTINEYQVDCETDDVYVVGMVAEEGKDGGIPFEGLAISEHDSNVLRMHHTAQGCAKNNGSDMVGNHTHVGKHFRDVQNFVGDPDSFFYAEDGKVKAIETKEDFSGMRFVVLAKDVNQYVNYRGRFVGGIADRVDKFYENADMCMLFNEVECVDMDGTTRKIGGVGNKFKLTEEQMELVSQIQELISKAEQKGVQFIYDVDEDKIRAFNGAEKWEKWSDELECNEDEYNDLYARHLKKVVTTLMKCDISYFNEECGIFVKKEE